MNDKEADDLMSDEFLDSLEESSIEVEKQIMPSWVVRDKEHDSYKAWHSILELKSSKEELIKAHSQIADRKTPKGLYKLKKSEVARLVGKAPQNLFRGKPFYCKKLCDFLDDQNDLLLALFMKQQEKLQKTTSRTGVRAKNKESVVDELQRVQALLSHLRRKHVKDSIDLVISRMPLDLQQKLKS